MCGILAFFSHIEIDDDVARNALNVLSSRGPDGEGIWKTNNIYLGHRRLAILDLDNRSDQPLHSYCNRYVIIFNGEIYNYNELKLQLIEDGFVFNTNSDTEVILNLFISKGPNFLNHLKGMYSLVIWDKIDKIGFVARDPYGIKPLYIATYGNGIIISSQIKAIISTGLISMDLDLNSEASFFLTGSVPEPNTWFKNIKAVQSGSYLILKDSKIVKTVKYLDIGNIFIKSNFKNITNKIDIQIAIRNSLQESVKRHLISDVPIAVFLSGGIDSAALVGIMKDQGVKNIQAITIAYSEFLNTQADEVPMAKYIADFYKINHHVRIVTKEEFLRDFPLIIESMDQPSIDGINTWFASKTVKELGIKVVLSGVGGDELFYGYKHYKSLPKLVTIFKCLNFIPFFTLFSNTLFYLGSKFFKNDRLSLINEWLTNISSAYLLKRLVMTPNEISNKNLKLHSFLKNFNPINFIYDLVGPISYRNKIALSQIESNVYLKNQLLRDSDWSSMAHGIELRTPLVDYSLLTEIQPYFLHLSKFPKKSLLSNAPLKPLTSKIYNKKKTGFGIPVKSWLKEEFNETSLNYSDLILQKYNESITKYLKKKQS